MGAIGGPPAKDKARATALRKLRKSGELYERDPKVEAGIVELAALSRDELVTRAAIRDRSDPRHVPSECLVYLIRATRQDSNEAWFERLYRILAERVLRGLPKAESADGTSESLTPGLVREKVLGRFSELLASLTTPASSASLALAPVSSTSARPNPIADRARWAWASTRPGRAHMSGEVVSSGTPHGSAQRPSSVSRVTVSPPGVRSTTRMCISYDGNGEGCR